MDLSNLKPAEGSKHSDNFRRGRGHGSGNGKTVRRNRACHTFELRARTSASAYKSRHYQNR